jgi:hypothetical protein
VKKWRGSGRRLSGRGPCWVGHGTVRELVLHAPLVVPDHGGVHIQVVVGPEDADGRAVSVHSRPEDSDGTWTRHAEGTLAATSTTRAMTEVQWPPAGAEPVDVSGAYQRTCSASGSCTPAAGVSATSTTGAGTTRFHGRHDLDL